jgi:hypothetical protein
MLDRLAPLAHLLRMLVEPALHRLKDALMFPSGKPVRLVRFMAVVRSLTGIVYEDDNQIAEPHLKRADDKVWPTIEISVFHLI